MIFFLDTDKINGLYFRVPDAPYIYIYIYIYISKRHCEGQLKYTNIHFRVVLITDSEYLVVVSSQRLKIPFFGVLRLNFENIYAMLHFNNL